MTFLLRLPLARSAVLLAILAAAAAGAPPLGAAPPDGSHVYAIRGCRVIPVAGPVLAKGTIVLRGGLIEAVGPVESTAVPPDAEVVEADGLTAYPGLVLAHSGLFLETPRREGETPRFAPPAAAPAGAAAEERFPPGPGLMAFEMLKPQKDALDAWLKAGVAAALVAPARGIFQGQSVLLCLNGLDPAAMVLRNPAALHVAFATERDKYPESLMGTVALLRQRFLDAGWYARAQAQYAKTPLAMRRPAYDPALEALLPYARRERPVVFQCSTMDDVKRALKLGAELDLDVAVSGANEAWRILDALRGVKAPLLVTLDFRAPAGSLYASQGDEARKKAEAELYPANPAALAKAGIPFALTALNVADATSFLKAVRAAIKAGLPRDKALEALTAAPARALGFGDRLGTLQPGRIANVVLARGEVFEESSVVEKVFVDGVLFRFEEKAR